MRNTLWNALIGCSLAALMMLTPRMAEAQAPGTAVLSGRVFRDPTMQPIAEAEVTIVEIERSVLSDAKGLYLIKDIPPGIYTVRGRRLGFALFETQIEFKAGKTVEKAIVLPSVTALDSVKVVGEVSVPLSFLEHRSIGFGNFLTRTDLAQMDGASLASAVSQLPGLQIARGKSNQGWALSKRNVQRLSTVGRVGNGINVPGRDMYFPDDYEKSIGLPAGCYARVYLDNVLLNGSTPADPVNLNEFATRNIEAVEYYAGPSQTPSKYSRLNAVCGVLVLHTRKKY